MMSAAQSTSTPSFRMVSERKSRLAREVSTRSTRFFLGATKEFKGRRVSVGELTPPPSSLGLAAQVPLTSIAASGL
jgi:hypothetical protein